MSDATQTVNDQSGQVGESLRWAGPTVLRMLVGAELRRLREARGVSTEKAAYRIRGSASKISRMELGRVGFKERDVADLLTYYDVTDPAGRDQVLAMAKQASVPGWWQPYTDLVPAWFEPYLGLEQGAGLIRTYEAQFVPGLLQTEDYARAVIALGLPAASVDEVETRVELRRERQRILTRPVPTRLWAVLDEGLLRRSLGGPAVMRAQLRHLIEISELPNVTLQVMPFSAGGHPALGAPVTILRLPEAVLPDVVYLEQPTTAHYPDKPSEIFYYTDMVNRLAVEAEPSSKTTAFLHRVLRET